MANHPTFFNHTTSEIPKIIWTYWDSDQLPEVVQLCIETWKKTNPDYTIHIVSKKTLNSYLPGNTIFSFPHCKSSPARTSDFIRLYLLYKYGGFWIDASIILNGSLNYFLKIQEESKCEFIGYYLSSFTTRPEFPVIESWFLVAVPKSKVVKVWLDCFLLINKYVWLESYIDWVRNEEKVDLQKISSPIYLSIHVACQHMLQKFLTPEEIQSKIYLEKAEDGPFKYLAENNWDSEKALLSTCSNPSLRTLVYKMRGKERSTIERNKELLCIFF